jgi:ArsR family transcriptional regulator
MTSFFPHSCPRPSTRLAISFSAIEREDLLSQSQSLYSYEYKNDVGSAIPPQQVKFDMATQCPNTSIVELSAILRLLSNHTRLRILLLLARQREIHVGELCRRLQETQPAISYHLSLLRTARLIDFRREGKFSFYQFVPHRFETIVGPLIGRLLGSGGHVRFKDYVLSHEPRLARSELATSAGGMDP